MTKQERRGKREEAKDWVSVAMEDLKPELVELEAYGIMSFSPEAIKKLEGLRAGRTAVSGAAAD